MLKRLRKSSGRVTLVLIGVAALAGCADDRRNVYASREDCLADWGNNPADCTPATDQRHASRGFYYGPMHSYRSSSGSGWGRCTGSFSSSRSSSSRSIAASGSYSRGGFGSSGRSSSS